MKKPSMKKLMEAPIEMVKVVEKCERKHKSRKAVDRCVLKAQKRLTLGLLK